MPCGPSGEAALEVLAKEPVDLVLIDIMMPGMTGLSLFRHLKEFYPDIAVVFVTAVDDTDAAIEHFKHGAYDYIFKPISRPRLSHMVKDMLDRHAAMMEKDRNRKLLEEGIPLGTLTLIEGIPSGKSVLCQHLTYEALLDGHGVAYFSSDRL